MKKKNSRHIRAYPEDIKKIKDLQLEISRAQGKIIPAPEIIRRTLNIPALKEVLYFDAEIKRRKKNG